MSDVATQDVSGFSEATARRAAALIAVAYLLLALAYGVINPLFEAPDEHWHYFTAQTIAEERRLPRVEEPADPWLGQEAAQPPLYYILAALVVAPLDTEGAREVVWSNPRVQLGDASNANNINAFVHGPWEAWPWRGYALAAHVLRIYSSLLGLGTLLFIYGSGRRLWPAQPRRALLAMALVAFLPQFLFVHSAVTNDALITLLCAFAIWQLIRLWRGPAQNLDMLLLGVTIGLAILSKTAGLLLLVYACGVLLLRAFSRGESLWLALQRTATLVVGPALLVGGWLLVRNWSFYGDLTAANQFVAIAGGDRGFTLAQVLSEGPGLWASFVAVFGWFNVRAPLWVYWLWNALAALAVGGAAWRALARRWRAGTGATTACVGSQEADGRIIALWLALWPLLVYAGLLIFMLRTPAAQGRLLFPGLAPLALGMALGLDSFGRLRALFPVAALVTSLVCLLVVIPTAYEKPALLATDALPAETTPLEVELDDGLQLLGFSLETPLLQPGDTAWMTLYWRWRAPQPAAELDARDAPQLVVEIFGRQEALVGKFQGYHGRGLYPATLWPQETIVVERLGIPLTHTMRVPTEARVQVGLASPAQRVTLGALEVEPAQWPPAPQTALAQLGERIRLVGATVAPEDVAAGDTVHVSLSWHVLQDVSEPLTTFVHLGQPTAAPLAQGDSLPLGGDYPTNRWQAGEIIVGDEYAVQTPPALAAGRYPLLVGMYNAQDGRRLPLFAGGNRQAQDAYLLGWVVVR